MTARVLVDLTSRLEERARLATCPGCSPQRTCYAHRLEALAQRLRAGQLNEPTALLLAASDVAATLGDVLEVLDGITSECLPATDRSVSRTGASADVS